MGRQRKECREVLACWLWFVRSLVELPWPGPSNLHSDVIGPGNSSEGDFDLRPAKQLQDGGIPASQIFGGQLPSVIQTLVFEPSWIHSDEEFAPD